MEFTYESYETMLKKLMDRGYVFRDYQNWNEAEKTVILRHDIDFSLKKAVYLSEIEKKMEVGGATYFVLLATDFYNICSKESREYIEKIIDNGGKIGLHFDETQYIISSEEKMKECVYKERDILEKITGLPVNVVSMHRPSENILSSNIEFEGIINSYSDMYFKKMKYLSDSRRHWRENINMIIDEKNYMRLHILTHPFWYNNEEKCLKQTLKEAILEAALNCYDNMDRNFRDLGRELERDEISRMIGN